MVCLLLEADFIYATSKKPHYLKSKWLKLLRYESHQGRYQSLVVNKDFFLTDDGSRSPRSEWMAILGISKKLDSNKVNGSSKVCKFPARFLHVMVVEAIDTAPLYRSLTKCEEFKKFVSKVAIKGVSVVFSSYYLGSPASAFGHTFLRIHNARAGEKGNELLDYGVNFAATVDTANPLIYGIKGIFGGFAGSFSLLPYFLKKLEYSDLELRDIWSYKINFTPKELEFFTLHLWEMNYAKFDYSYFKENCSYHILLLIDAVLEKKGLISELRPFIIPLETLVPLWKQEGLLSKGTLRPSQKKVFGHMLEQLNDKEKKAFHLLINNEIVDISKFDDTSKAKIIEMQVLYGDLFHRKKLLDKKAKDASWKKQRQLMLSKRAKLKVSGEVFKSDFNLSDDPINSHSARKIKLEYRYLDSNTSIASFGHRFALHELLDPFAGFAPFSELVMGDFQFRYKEDDNTASIEKFHLFRVSHFPSWDKIFRPMGWEMAIGLERSYKLKGDSPLSAFVKVAPGYSYTFFKETLLSVSAVADLRHFLSRRKLTIWSEVQLFSGINTKFSMLISDFIRTSLEYEKTFAFGPDRFNELYSIDMRIDLSKQYSLSAYYGDGSAKSNLGWTLHYFY